MSVPQRSSPTVLELLLVLFSVVSIAFAQTSTTCNPLNVTCSPDPAFGTNATFNLTDNTLATKLWTVQNGGVSYTDDGAEFTINTDDGGPTIVSNFYIFFGRVSTVMKGSPGKGIVSSVVLLSDDLDEIDWEFVGGNATSIQSNYYGKGDNTTFDRVAYHPITDPFEQWHNYTTIWTNEKLEWWIDGGLVRTLNFADAKGGSRYPQTPCQVKLGSWVAGKKGAGEGRIEWSGGIADFSKGQSYTMSVQSLYVQDYGSGKEYTYGDHSGTWQSIKETSGQSEFAKYLTSPHGISASFRALSKPAQIAIICVAIGIGAVLFLTLVFCCIKQRRAGKKERLVADAEYEKGAAELMEFRHRQTGTKMGAMSPGGYVKAPSQDGEFPKMPNVAVMEQGRPMKSGWL